MLFLKTLPIEEATKYRINAELKHLYKKKAHLNLQGVFFKKKNISFA
jgi:hypothetical protein